MSPAEIFEPPEEGSIDGAWRWRELPNMSVHREGHAACVMSDGRFAVLGGMTMIPTTTMIGGVYRSSTTTSCEALSLDGRERWESLPDMLVPRYGCVCVALEGCVIVAGGVTGGPDAQEIMEVYEEDFGVWRRLPCVLPYELFRPYELRSARVASSTCTR